MSKYYARDWAGALAAFEKSATLEPLQPGIAPGVSSSPSLVYQKIAINMRDNPPPEDWDGVYVMTEK